MSTDATVNYPVNALCEIAQVASAYEGFTVPAAFTASSNRELQRLIVEITQRIESLTGKYFGKYTGSLEVHGMGGTHLWLSEYTSNPLLSCSAVQYRAIFEKTYDWDAEAETVSADAYDISESGTALVRVSDFDEGRVRTAINGEWIKGFKNYRVTGVWGAEEVPATIERVCILAVREAITPGYVLGLESLGGESFPDGYSYYRQVRSTDKVPKYFGIDILDRLIHPFVCDDPGVGFAVP